ncbi:MAG: hypothetical protein IJD92_03265 [Bacilli bacterium]|nr:hypothetical protein [Bacilli bacterium]
MKEYETRKDMFLDIIINYENNNIEEAFKIIKDYYANRREYNVACRSSMLSTEERKKLLDIREEYEKDRALKRVSQNELEAYKIFLKEKTFNNIDKFMELHKRLKLINMSFFNLDRSLSKEGLQFLYNKEEILRIKSNALDYINFYYTNKEELDKLIKKDEEKEVLLPLAEKTISDYLNGNFKSIYDYCLVRDCDQFRFKKYIEILKSFNSIWYKKYEEKLNESKVDINDLISTWKNVLVGIDSGKIKKDNTIRKYDALDYFTDSKYSYETMIKHLEIFAPKEELIIFKRFLVENRLGFSLNDKDIEKIYSSKIEKKLMRDKNGIPIPNTGRIISLDEKKAIIEYMKTNHIPLNSKLFDIAVNRFVDDELEIALARKK